jgi:hypothetical protein
VRPFLAGLWPALLTAGVLLAYPLWFQYCGPQSYRGLPGYVLAYGTNLRAFPAFSQLSLVRHGASYSSYGVPPEENTFLGAPLLIVAGLIVAWLWRRVAVRALAIVALVFAVLSLGRTVKIGNRTLFHHGPMSLLGKLPLFNNVVPTRFGLALIPVIAILLAFSVRAAATAPDARLRYGWMLVLAGALLPIAPTSILVKPAVPVPAFFTGPQRAAFRADLRYWHTAIVVLSPDAPHYDQLRNALNQLTGEPARHVPGLLLWDVQALSG